MTAGPGEAAVLAVLAVDGSARRQYTDDDSTGQIHAGAVVFVF